MASIITHKDENINRIRARIAVQQHKAHKPVIQCAKCPAVLEPGQERYVAGDERVWCEGCVDTWIRNLEMD